MNRFLKYYKIMFLRHDLAAGISVFLVALPLCLGIALASGAPLYAGLLSGIIGGLVAGTISKSNLAVSGPAAGLSTLVAATIISSGDYRIFLLSVIIAGLFQIILGLFKLGVIANYFPSSVIKGMLAAIGIILISKQIPLALGYDKPDFWTSGFLDLFSSSNVFGNLTEFSSHFTLSSVIITLLSFGAMFLKKITFLKILHKVPAPLLAVLTGVFLNYAILYTVPELALSSSQLVHIPDNLFSNISFPDWSALFSSVSIWKDGIVIGTIASLETLLCIEAIDKLDKHNRITPVNRELVAQGIGNIFCGVLGAIPITAVIVRGSANVDAGARTKLSTITHGIFLLLAIMLVPFVLNKIPYASLAAILLLTGYNLTKPVLYKTMWKLKWAQFLPFIITIVMILATDLLIGVSIGLLLSVYFIIQNNFRSEFNISKTIVNGIANTVIKLHSNVTFLNKVNLKKELDEIPEYSVLVIDGKSTNFIDNDILEIISEYQNKAKDRHIELQLKEVDLVNVVALH